jgi:hypothetical protein
MVQPLVCSISRVRTRHPGKNYSDLRNVGLKATSAGHVLLCKACNTYAALQYIY